MLSFSPLLPKFPDFNGTFLSLKPFSKPLILPSSRIKNSLSSPNSPPQDDLEDFQVLTSTRSQYNNIIILESKASKVLLLDESCNVHSILYKGHKWTNSYWDEFTTLPAIVPPGPIAVFGLGGGTMAHQMLHFWPSLCIHGYELDEVLLDRAREFLGLSELEMVNDAGGVLKVQVGDALCSEASVEGGFAGIVVDLFSEAKVLPELEKAETWLEMKEKLMPNGRIMVNCGGDILLNEESWEVNLTIKAMCEAFGRKLVNWRKMPKSESGNYLAFTGCLPDLDLWCSQVPEKLSLGVKLWRSCESVH